jgi:hypothetical protein
VGVGGELDRTRRHVERPLARPDLLHLPGDLSSSFVDLVRGWVVEAVGVDVRVGGAVEGGASGLAAVLELGLGAAPLGWVVDESVGAFADDAGRGGGVGVEG